jgi:hypothetical protein
MTKLRFATQFIAITLLICLGSAPLGAQQVIKDVKGCIEGLYVLTRLCLRPTRHVSSVAPIASS